MARTPNRVAERWRCLPQVEILEDRCMLSWASVPPPRISLPRGQSVFLDGGNNADGFNYIGGKQLQFYRFTATVSGNYRFAAQTPTSDMDTVAALYKANGRRLAYNDDLAADNTDSEFTANLVAGKKYYFGVSKYKGKPGGEYYWLIDGPGGAGGGGDAYEENDSFYEAADLGVVSGLTTINNLNMDDEADWFRFTLNTPGTASSYVRIDFSHAQGDLDMYLYDDFGWYVDLSGSATDVEQISLNGLAAGSYRLLVLPYEGAANPIYTLSVANGSGGGDDVFEDNDSFGQAHDLGTLTSTYAASNLVMADSADWFRFTTNGAGTASDSVVIQFQNALGDLDMRLYNSSAVQVGSSLSFTDSETISLNGLAAGTYYLEVYGDLGAFNPSYSLAINPPSGAVTSNFQITLTFSGLSSSQQAIFQQAAARWSQIIVGDLPDATYFGNFVDDLRIDASAVFIDGQGNILGQAGPDTFRSGSQLPIHGIMQFDTADMAMMESQGILLGVILHEMGHVLGIGTIWETLGLLSGKGGSNPRFHGAQATAEYNALFGGSASSVPVENVGGPGSRDAHWRESIFDHELMTSIAESGPNMPISRMTIASLADLGYQVNLNAADPYTLPSALKAAPTATQPATGIYLAAIRGESRPTARHAGNVPWSLFQHRHDDRQAGPAEPAPLAVRVPVIDPVWYPTKDDARPSAKLRVAASADKGMLEPDAFAPFCPAAVIYPS